MKIISHQFDRLLTVNLRLLNTKEKKAICELAILYVSVGLTSTTKEGEKDSLVLSNVFVI